MITKESEIKEKFGVPFNHLIVPIIASLGLHAFGYGIIDHSMRPGSEWEIGSRTTLDERVRTLIEEPQCEVNSERGVYTLEEQAFVEDLVEDLQDERLDSISFGEWMVKAETFVHNREAYCNEDKWDVTEKLEDYSGIRDFVLSDFNSENDLVFAENVFDYLHERILLNYSEPQSRSIEALETGDYNCYSGTLWMTALLSEKLKNRVGVCVYDTHMITSIENKAFFDNTSSSRKKVSKHNCVYRPKEEFVVEYIVQNGMKESLPLMFREWYNIMPANGLINYSTNAIGTGVAVGVRNRTSDEELSDVPFGYEIGSKGISVVPFDSERFNWGAVFNANRTFLEFMYSFDNNNDASLLLLDRERFILLQLYFSEDKVESFDFDGTFRENLKASDYLFDVNFDYLSSNITAVKTPRSWVYEQHFKRQNNRVVREIVDGGDYKSLEQKFIGQNLMLLSSNEIDHHLLFLMTADYLKVKKRWDVSNNDIYRDRIAEIAYFQWSSLSESDLNAEINSGYYIDLLLAFAVFENNPIKIERTLNSVVKNKRESDFRAVLAMTFEFNDLWSYSQTIDIVDDLLIDCSDENCSALRYKLCSDSNYLIPKDKFNLWCSRRNMELNSSNN